MSTILIFSLLVHTPVPITYVYDAFRVLPHLQVQLAPAVVAERAQPALDRELVRLGLVLEGHFEEVDVQAVLGVVVAVDGHVHLEDLADVPAVELEELLAVGALRALGGAQLEGVEQDLAGDVLLAGDDQVDVGEPVCGLGGAGVAQGHLAGDVGGRGGGCGCHFRSRCFVSAELINSESRNELSWIESVRLS